MGRNRRGITDSQEETIAFGKKIGQQLGSGSIVCLWGDLGAGKTTLIKGIVEGITGLPHGEVRSPTFTYLNIYANDTSLPVYHFDLYRLNDAEEFLSLGFEEFLFGEGICCIEWSEKIRSILPETCLHLLLSYEGENRRSIIYDEIFT